MVVSITFDTTNAQALPHSVYTTFNDNSDAEALSLHEREATAIDILRLCGNIFRMGKAEHGRSTRFSLYENVCGKSVYAPIMRMRDHTVVFDIS